MAATAWRALSSDDLTSQQPLSQEPSFETQSHIRAASLPLVFIEPPATQPSCIENAVLGDMQQPCRQGAGHVETNTKRQREETLDYSENDDTMRKLHFPTAQVPTPFRPLKITKTGTYPAGSADFKQHDPLLFCSSPSTDRLTLFLNLKRFEGDSTTGYHWDESITEALDMQLFPELFVGGIADSYPSHINNGYPESDAIQACHEGGGLDDESNDEYPLESGLEDEDIIRLCADTPRVEYEYCSPPSNVQFWDHDSRSAVEYDPNLQFSSPQSGQEGNPINTEVRETHRNQGVDDDLLEDDVDVDWDAVFNAISVIPKGSSSCHPSPRGVKTPPAVSRPAYRREPETVGSELFTGVLEPFARPPFPERVRDRAAVPGASSNTVVRTCFRIGAMISQTAFCFNHKQDVVFELFARVTYSSRESLSKKQHFQFIDLFKNRHPFPAGVLMGWRTGGQLDKESSKFLNTANGPLLCRCICKPTRDVKTLVGWTYTILRIREANWSQVLWAKRVICGD
ncbi:hypothetical protein F5Y16DRAFT_399400 [Xylariaceae sp. FL0255]|nr:hypothetical protein F5Y16DRAFT_399400 [Xylariaceae sp. FL0255]